jgi:hypothetical protein
MNRFEELAETTRLDLRQWWDVSSQQPKFRMLRSPKVRLVAGRRYFIEAVEKSATNSSAWKIPGAEREIIPGEFLSPFKTKIKTKETKR